MQLLPVTITSGAQGILVVYDITDKESFEAVKTWVSEVKKYSQPDVIKILIGNKTDLEDKREVTTEEGVRLAEILGMEFLETSAKEKENVEEAFRRMTKKVLEEMEKRGVPEEDTPNINEIMSKRKKESGGCGC